MLVLSRMVDEAVVIGSRTPPIRVVVTEIRGDKVRLGIEAPGNIEVHREEIWNEIHANKQTGGSPEAKSGGR